MKAVRLCIDGEVFVEQELDETLSDLGIDRDTELGFVCQEPLSQAQDEYWRGMFLEYIDGGTLWTAIDNDNKTNVMPDRHERYRHWAAEIVDAMQFLHGAGALRPDLKPNIEFADKRRHQQRWQRRLQKNEALYMNNKALLPKGKYVNIRR